MQEFLVHLSKRPIKSLIIYDVENPNSEIDEVVKFCTSCWGGINNIIIPSNGIKIKEEWIKIANLLSFDICIINSKLHIQDFQVPIYDYFGHIVIIPWKKEIINRFIKNQTSFAYNINLISYLNYKYRTAFFSNETNIIKYNIQGYKEYLFKYLISQIGLHDDDFFKILTPNLKPIKYNESLLNYYDLFKFIKTSQNYLTPIYLTRLGLKQHSGSSFNLEHPLMGPIIAHNVLGIIVSDTKNFIEGFCLKWNLNRFPGANKNILFFPRALFSSLKNIEAFSKFLTEEYPEVSFLTVFTPRGSRIKAQKLSKPLLNVENIKEVFIYYDLNERWFSKGASLMQDDAITEITRSENNQLLLKCPRLKDYYSYQDEGWAVDCFVDGLKHKYDGYYIPQLPQFQDLYGRNLRISSGSNFSFVVFKKADYLSLNILDCISLFKRLFSRTNYKIKESSITYKTNAIIKIIGGLENISIFQEDEIRDTFRAYVPSSRNQLITRELPLKTFQQNIKNKNKLKFLLQFLSERGILVRGSIIVCPKCNFKNWYSIDNIKETIECNGCYSNFQIPFKLQTYYRLNELFRQNFGEDGSIPVLLTLYFLKQFSKKSFLFATGLDIYDNCNKITDIDIACICDGKVFLIECKDFEEGYDLRSINRTKRQISKLHDIGNQINCDAVLLSCLISPSDLIIQSLLDWSIKYKKLPPISIIDRRELVGYRDDDPEDIQSISNINQITRENINYSKLKFIRGKVS